MIKIIDNFLTKEEHEKVCEALFSDVFPWYFNEYVVSSEETQCVNSFQFVHTFYREHSVTSNLFPVLAPIIEKTKPQALVRIKANLIPTAKKVTVAEFHTDTLFKCLTGIYYLNTTNGPTVFETGEKINSVANRFVVFDSNLRHASSRCTDHKRRCVINFNYFGDVDILGE
jgi:hypothetical protein